MSDRSKIEWTDRTWNPTRGCSRISEGCRNCYAERQAARFVNQGEVGHGPFGGFATKVNGHPAWTGNVQLIESKLNEPLSWRKPQRVFVNSMSDLFHENLSDEAIDRVFAVMALCPQHTFQVLTKRPARMQAYFAGEPLHRWVRLYWRWLKESDGVLLSTLKRDGWSWAGDEIWPGFLPNVWLGVSVENQKAADYRIPMLLQTPAAVRFVSYEPALEPVDFDKYLRPHWTTLPGADSPPWLDWVIVGGESGPGARPFDIAWARSTIEQCEDAGVSCFVKQLGAKPFFGGKPFLRPRGKKNKGGDIYEWPADLRVREFPA